MCSHDDPDNNEHNDIYKHVDNIKLNGDCSNNDEYDYSYIDYVNLNNDCSNNNHIDNSPNLPPSNINISNLKYHVDNTFQCHAAV